MSDDNDAFAEGREAYDAGQSETSNPYPDDSEDHLSWNDGYREALEEDGEDDDDEDEDEDEDGEDEDED
jgi:ribosome modulation factor